jgi:hypothetical protein
LSAGTVVPENRSERSKTWYPIPAPANLGT